MSSPDQDDGATLTGEASKEASWGIASTVAAVGDRPANRAGGGATALLSPEGLSGRYEILGRLGAGGMGCVDRVWDRDLMRELAVKQMRPELCTDERLTRQFLWEARVTAYLDHPNIVAVHDLGLTEDQQLYFTMKHVRGLSLEQVLERLRDGDEEITKQFSKRKRLRLFHALVEVVAFAHERGVLHRDLKPSNVMLGDHGDLQVMDWGLATPLATPEGERIAEVRPEGIELESSSGTPLYMSPEQAAAEALDQRSDIYTLGVILYELMSLSSPYAATTVSEVLSKVKQAKSLPVRLFDPDADPSVVAVLERAMARDPDERYEDASALARDIEMVIDGRTPDAEEANVVQRATRFYVAPDPALGRLRFAEVDLMMLSSMLVGAALAVFFYAYLQSWGWALVALAALAAVPPARAYLRALRQREDRD